MPQTSPTNNTAPNTSSVRSIYNLPNSTSDQSDIVTNTPDFTPNPQANIPTQHSNAPDYQPNYYSNNQTNTNSCSNCCCFCCYCCFGRPDTGGRRFYPRRDIITGQTYYDSSSPSLAEQISYCCDIGTCKDYGNTIINCFSSLIDAAKGACGTCGECCTGCCSSNTCNTVAEASKSFCDLLKGCGGELLGCLSAIPKACSGCGKSACECLSKGPDICCDALKCVTSIC